MRMEHGQGERQGGSVLVRPVGSLLHVQGPDGCTPEHYTCHEEAALALVIQASGLTSISNTGCQPHR